MGDVNGLKVVNDTLGHRTGDRVLIDVAELLRESCGGKYTLGRWGGDEFLILLEGAGASMAREVCDRIRRACREADGEFHTRKASEVLSHRAFFTG